MNKILIIYWSGTGNTEIMAQRIEEGAKDAGADVKLLTVSEATPEMIDEYDYIAFGCSAMGAEELEETEFEPYFAKIEAKLSGKKIALFGSYSWADGEWMRIWNDRVKTDGALLFEDAGLIAFDTPDDEAQEKCKTFGKQFATWQP